MVLRSIFSSPNKLIMLCSDHGVFINLSTQNIGAKTNCFMAFFYDYMGDIKSLYAEKKTSHLI